MIIKGYAFSFLYIAAVILFSMLLYRLGIKKTYTRKVIHILIGFVFVLLDMFVGVGSVHFLIVCLVCLGLLFLDYRLHLLPHMSSDGDNSPGTVYYAVAMSAMAAVSMLIPNTAIPFGIAVFCTSLGDGLAGVVGQVKRYNPRIWNNKTLLGALTCFFISSIGLFLLSEIISLNIGFLECLAIGIAATELELFVSRGLDNLTVPLGVFFISYLLIEAPEVCGYILPITVIPLMIAIVSKRKLLTPVGTICAALLGVGVSCAFGNSGFFVLLIFFVGSILADKIKKVHGKTGQNKIFAIECRTAVQVIANGGVPLIASLLYIVFGERMFLLAYVAVLAEALADTTSSSFGSLSGSTYDLFRLRKCESGISGGMSIPGTLSALISSALLALFAFTVGMVSAIEMLAIAGLGFIGSIFDSLLGSLFQAKYTCRICGKTVESKMHCNSKTELCRGLSFVNNSMVNFLSTLFVFIVSLLIFM